MTKAQSEHLAGDLVAFKAGANNLDRYFLSHGVVIEVEGMVNESYYYGGATGEYWYYSVLTFDGKVLRVREDNLQKYSNRLNKLRSGRSEENTSELQSPMRISYAVFCYKKKQ